MSRGPYRTTATDAEVASLLRGARSAVILTHAKPDGDAVGSVIALARLMQHLGAKATVWLVGPFPPWLDRIAGSVPVLRFSPHEPPPAEEFDRIVVADTGSWVQLEQLAPWVRQRTSRTVVIDHHLSGDEDVATVRCIDSKAAATAEVVGRIARLALGLDGRPLPADLAEPLYLGLGTDTGWFKFSNVTPATLRLAADLLESGVDAPGLYELIEQQDAPGRLALLARALASHELVPIPPERGGGHACVMTLRHADYKACGAEGEDTGGFSQHALAVASVRVSVILSEQSPAGADKPLTKASLRSKPGPDAIDVAAACQTLGGGGHARAAGAKLALPVEAARRRVLAALGIGA